MNAYLLVIYMAIYVFEDYPNGFNYTSIGPT